MRITANFVRQSLVTLISPLAELRRGVRARARARDYRVILRRRCCVFARVAFKRGK